MTPSEAVLDALADVDTAWRCAGDATVTKTAGRLLRALDEAALAGEDVTLSAAAVAAAIRPDANERTDDTEMPISPDERASFVVEFVEERLGVTLEPWQRDVIGHAIADGAQPFPTDTTEIQLVDAGAAPALCSCGAPGAFGVAHRFDGEPCELLTGCAIASPSDDEVVEQLVGAAPVQPDTQAIVDALVDEHGVDTSLPHVGESCLGPWWR